MTKRHFEAIAALLDANVAPYHIVADFADLFAEENPRFDKARFFKAATNTLHANAERTVRMLEREY